DCSRNDTSTDSNQEAMVMMNAELAASAKQPESQEFTEQKTNGEREEGEGEKTEASKDEPQDEGEETSVLVEAELARMEERWREQCVINDNFKVLLTDEEKRFKVRYTHFTDSQ
ncbi:tax1-binding protein 1 homolog A isoform X1, partial [Tachysurus ichikawai]